ncbi:hypothetical protein [Ligilactobacillus equi]
MAKITPATLQYIANKLGAKYRQFNSYLVSLKLPLKYAYRMDFISNNPFDKVVFPKRVSEGVIKKIDKKDNFFTKQELNDFLSRLQVKAHAEQKYTLFRLLAFSGIRISEALSLN